MRTRLVGVVLAALVATVLSAQAPPPTTSARIWEGRTVEVETFLKTAPFRRFEEVPIGVTRPLRAFFDEGALVTSVAWKVLPPGRSSGYWESYKSEIAAYELDKLLGMHMVPPAVEKRWKHEVGAAVLWLQPVRAWKDVEHMPKPDSWNRQAVRMKMFDNLIGNPDRNAGNLLVDDSWNLYLIDHSRAFVSDTRLPVVMVRIEPELWARMLALDEPTLVAAIGKWIGRGSVRAMLKRRDKMKVVVERLLKNGNESLVYVR